MEATLNKHETPVLFREPYVDSGYRRTHQPWLYYVRTLFQRHNECMNIWTHVIAFVYTAHRLYGFSRQFDLVGDPYMWPLVSGMITTLLLYGGSAGAHWFHSRSELVHYTCFMVDYSCLGLFGLGSTQFHYAYSSDPWLFSLLENIYLPIAIYLCIQFCVCCSVSKARYRRPYPFARKLWQVLPASAIYIWSNFPLFLRLLRCLQTDQWDNAMGHHLQQIMCFITGGLFFGSHIPERFYPGRFDFIGHSHQLFHVFVFMTLYNQIYGLEADIKQYHHQIYSRPAPTVWSTFGALAFVGMANLLVIRACREYVKRCQKHTTVNDCSSNGHQRELKQNTQSAVNDCSPNSHQNGFDHDAQSSVDDCSPNGHQNGFNQNYDKCD